MDFPTEPFSSSSFSSSPPQLEPPILPNASSESFGLLETNIQGTPPFISLPPEKLLVPTPEASNTPNPNNHLNTSTTTTNNNTNGNKKKLVRKHVPVIVGHVVEGQTYRPHFKFTRFSTATSNVDITRNITNRFLTRPQQEVLKFRMEDSRKNLNKEVLLFHFALLSDIS